MSVYRRYFQVKDELTLQRVRQYLDARSAYIDSVRKVADELGASEVSWYDQGGQFAAFQFQQEPDMAIFKRVDHKLYAPKKNSKQSRAIWAKINAVPAPGGMEKTTIEPLGLGWCGLVDGNRMYRSCIYGSEKAGWFVSVPWRDESPEKLEQYKADHAAGNYYSAALDHLLWVPPAEWVELKEWQVKKALDEAGEPS